MIAWLPLYYVLLKFTKKIQYNEFKNFFESILLSCIGNQNKSCKISILFEIKLLKISYTFKSIFLQKWNPIENN